MHVVLLAQLADVRLY